MSIAPIVQSVHTKAEPARAFELFAGRITDWWPKGLTIGKSPHVAIILEPQVGGRWYERDAMGNETQWGRVLAWEPPARLLLAWQINHQWIYDPDLQTEVELRFAAAAAGGTVVTLEHRNLERFGADAIAHSAKLDGGWPKHLAQFAQYANDHS